MKKTLFTLFFILVPTIKGLACDLCKEKQPEMLKDIAHGAGPEGTIDIIIMWSAIVLVGGTLVLSLKLLIFPREKNLNHVKYLPFDDII